MELKWTFLVYQFQCVLALGILSSVIAGALDAGNQLAVPQMCQFILCR
uniref:Uncharacterized protein n=1 Tax=Medicago truncatula TaxID=3880 RepID=I3STU4_MEDTR|nr:unknown [Medicago truncatula]